MARFQLRQFPVLMPESLPPLSLGSGLRFEITEFTFDETTGDMAVTWNSLPGRQYTVFFTDDLNDLQQDGDVGDGITDNNPSDANPAEGVITYEFPNPSPEAPDLFFSVHEE